MDKKIKYLDTVRAIAIILIVVGHTLVHSYHCKMVFKFIYSFHVPLFFILSGYLYKKESTFKNYFIKKFKRLMTPYFIWIIIFTIIYLLFGKNVAKILNVNSTFNVLELFKNIIYGIGKDNLLKQNSSLWFLPALFSMSIFFYFYINEKNSNRIIILKSIILLIIGMVSTKYLKIYLPWGINTVLNAGILYYIGYIFNRYKIFSKQDKTNKYVIPLLITGGLAFYFNTTVMYIDYIYGNYLLMLVSSLSFSIIIFKISMLINENSLLEYIGKSTMGILIFHKIIIVIFQTKLGFISSMLLNSNFIIELMLTIVVTIFSIVVSLEIYRFLIKIIPSSFGIKKQN